MMLKSYFDDQSCVATVIFSTSNTVPDTVVFSKQIFLLHGYKIMYRYSMSDYVLKQMQQHLKKVFP